MKKYLIIFLSLAIFSACNEASEGGDNENGSNDSTAVSVDEENMESTGVFGEEITVEGSIPIYKLTTMMEEEQNMELKVTGEILDVCQRKGCWMKMDMGNGEKMMVRFTDYGFFVPKNAAGYTATLKGTAKKTLVTVEELKHYAGDEGKSDEEIAQIIESEEWYEFTADGVVIQEKIN